MILHREKAVHELMTVFAEDGVPLPARCGLAIKRLWFLLDIPDNPRRIGFVHNTGLFTDLDLYFAMCFFVKLDMRCNDPAGADCRHGLRKMLLAQRSFTTLLRVVKRDMWRKEIDVLKAWVEYKGSLTEDEQAEGVKNIFGVPVEKVGKLKYEYWGEYVQDKLRKEPQLLLRPDQLIIREAIRRGLRFHKHFLRSMCYGYVRPDTLEDYDVRDVTRRIEGLKVVEYGVDDEIGGVESIGEGDEEFDELLDLVGRRDVAERCVKTPKGLGVELMGKKNEEDEWLQRCMGWVQAEKADLMREGRW